MFLQSSTEEKSCLLLPGTWEQDAACLSLPSCPLRESSQPQLSKSPRLQFRVSVYMTPAELMAWTKAVSRFAVKWEHKESRCAKDFMARPVLEMTPAMQKTV